jgi:hypothetical protein
MMRPDSRFLADAMLLEWDHDRMQGDKRVISSRYHSDIADAVTYAFRECLHYLHEPAPPPKPTSGPDWAAQQEEDMVAELQRRVREEKELEEVYGWE